MSRHCSAIPSAAKNSCAELDAARARLAARRSAVAAHGDRGRARRLCAGARDALPRPCWTEAGLAAAGRRAAGLWRIHPAGKTADAQARSGVREGSAVCGRTIRARFISRIRRCAALYPPERRIALPTRFTMCGGPALVAAFDYLAGALREVKSVTPPTHRRSRQRIEPVGQRGRTGLQDQRRLDLVQFTVAHRRNRIEARARGDFRRHEFLAAPGADDDVGLRRDDIVGRSRSVRGALLRVASCGNTSMPPAISISSDTQPMPEIIGSSHSSK